MALGFQGPRSRGPDELNGPLRFGAIYTVGPYLLPSLVPLLRERAPQMPLVIEENFTARLLEQLPDNELDLAILALPADVARLSVWPVYDEDFLVLLPRGHAWERETQILARQLAGEKLLLLGPGHCFREQVIQACPKCVEPDEDGPRPQTGSSLETVRHMVVSGLGITVLPRASIANAATTAATSWPSASCPPLPSAASPWYGVKPIHAAKRLKRGAKPFSTPA